MMEDCEMFLAFFPWPISSALYMYGAYTILKWIIDFINKTNTK